MVLITRVLDLARMPGTWLAARLNVKSERGATAVEYGLMVALIAAVIIGVVWTLGQSTKNKFSCVANAVGNTTAASSGC